MIDQIINDKKPDFEKAIEHMEHEINSLRTGRASTALLSTVKVEIYGALTPIEHVASVNVADAKTLVISPWDKGTMPAIEKAIVNANLNLTPSNDGQVIRIVIPALNEQRRKELVKLLGGICESGKIGIRQVREDIMKAFKKAKEDGDISEDDLAHGQKKLQELVDNYNEMIKNAQSIKEKELMTV